MDSSKDIKLKVTKIVTDWELKNYGMFLSFLDARREKTRNLKNAFADLTKSTDFMERLLYEVPESLDGEFQMQLSDDELKFLHSKEGSLWFAKTFRQYTIPERV